MHVVSIIPPLVQLNSPYPSIAYLSSFFRSFSKTLPEGLIESVSSFDLSIELFHRIFSPQGLKIIFNESEKHALKLGETSDNEGDEDTAFNIYRYISSASSWVCWIDFIKSHLCSSSVSSREAVHEFLFSPFAPRGKRMDDYIESLDHELGADDAFFLCSLALADLADYITTCYDPDFSLVRYAESLALSEKSFEKLVTKLDSPVLKTFFLPLVQDMCVSLEKKQGTSCGEGAKYLFCISVPFAGTFSGALSCAKTIKNIFGKSALIAFGGGYINTELRETEETELFSFCDFLSYDRGYGSYYDFFTAQRDSSSSVLDGRSFYKIRYCIKSEDGKKKIIEDLSSKGESCNESGTEVVGSPDFADSKAKEFEDRATSTVYPDYEGIDFSRYPCLADDKNPMHRIWSDGNWLKAYLAHGCYWHRCAFCDVTLDYVHAYKKIPVKPLFSHLMEQAKKTGVYGVHFVDEAAPPVSLRDFAKENISLGPSERRLSFWGNIRFEKAFTSDLALFLSYGGLTAVSGGIEIAAEDGLDIVNKGTDLASLVSSCAAFKETGILVHAYMIYGFYLESPQLLIDSMETLRQLFKEGLLDSAFWHKFVLTKHSKVFSEWKKGKHETLKPVFCAKPVEKAWFAQNDIRFEGEQKSEKYGPPLDFALEAWMHGEDLEKSVQSWFSYSMPFPTVAENCISKLLDIYDQKRRESHNDYETFVKNKGWYVWIGDRLLLTGKPGGKNTAIQWIYFSQLMSVSLDSSDSFTDASVIVENLWKIRGERGGLTSISVDKNEDNSWKSLPLMRKLYSSFRGAGLISL